MRFAIALLLAATAAHAQYPAKPVRVIVGYAAGSSTDIVARVMADRLAAHWKQNVYVETRAGAAGNLAADAAAKSAPDGYTLLFAQNGLAISAAALPNLPYHAQTDLVPLAPVAATPHILIVAPEFPAKNVRELIARAKAEPGKLSFASSGVGNSDHLCGELFNLMAGISAIHVPYKGGAPAATAVAAGDVQFGVIALPGATPHLKSGRAKVAGITTAKKWAPEPAWSTPRDAGLDVDASIWSGLFAPKGTPQAVVDRVNGEVRKTLEQPDVKSRLGDAGFEAVGMTQAEFLARIRKDLERYREIVKAAGVKAD